MSTPAKWTAQAGCKNSSGTAQPLVAVQEVRKSESTVNSHRKIVFTVTITFNRSICPQQEYFDATREGMERSALCDADAGEIPRFHIAGGRCPCSRDRRNDRHVHR